MMICHIYYLNNFYMNNSFLKIKKLRFIYFFKIIPKLKVDDISLDYDLKVKYPPLKIISYKFL